LKSPKNYLDYKNYFANEKVLFVLQLTNRIAEVNIMILERIDFDLQITLDPNPEVKQRWYPLAISLHYEYAFPYAHEFISVQGRT